MNNLQVYRTIISPYQKKGFKKRERETLESISGINYIDRVPKKESIIITNTLTNVENIKEIDWNKVRLLIHPNSGYNNFSYDFVKKAKFPIVIGSSIRGHAVSNYILSCLFSHFSTIPKHKSWRKSRGWKRESILKNKSIQIIGYGFIGRILERSLTPLCRKVSIFDPFKDKFELNRLSDVVIPVANLNPTCKYFINKKFLSKLPKNYLIINAARGALINQLDLIDSLRVNKSASAYLDVYEKEPEDFNCFKGLNNIFTTSHIAGVYDDLDQEILNFEKKVITDFMINFDSPLKFNNIYKNVLMQKRLHENYLI